MAAQEANLGVQRAAISAATQAKTAGSRRRIRAAAKRRSGPSRLFLAGLGLAHVFAGGIPAAAADLCSAEGARRGVVRSVNEWLELTLEDGEILRIAGIVPPRPTPRDPDLDTKTRDRLAGWLGGHEILFRPLGGRRDRWGRTPALVFASAGPNDAATLAVGLALLDAGLARFDPHVDLPACRASLLNAEASARAAELGVWSDPYYAVISAADRESFAEKAGTSVIVEGRVTRVDVGGPRATLQFGPRRNWDFSVAILPRNIKKFDAAGLKLAEFAGQVLRVRGLLDMRFGPQIEISGPDEIEVIAQDRGEAPIGPAPQRR